MDVFEPSIPFTTPETHDRLIENPLALPSWLETVHGVAIEMKRVSWSRRMGVRGTDDTVRALSSLNRKEEPKRDGEREKEGRNDTISEELEPGRGKDREGSSSQVRECSFFPGTSTCPPLPAPPPSCRARFSTLTNTRSLHATISYSGHSADQLYRSRTRDAAKEKPTKHHEDVGRTKAKTRRRDHCHSTSACRFVGLDGAWARSRGAKVADRSRVTTRQGSRRIVEPSGQKQTNGTRLTIRIAASETGSLGRYPIREATSIQRECSFFPGTSTCPPLPAPPPSCRARFSTLTNTRSLHATISYSGHSADQLYRSRTRDAAKEKPTKHHEDVGRTKAKTRRRDHCHSTSACRFVGLDGAWARSRGAKVADRSRVTPLKPPVLHLKLSLEARVARGDRLVEYLDRSVIEMSPEFGFRA
ncbi:hypothetical protein WN48_00593 [Eufriesea mexicana]|uniref:Uncharacterized protein n=1 Tax=Eufriesea mexicana TaxID=516756 RepID=A0A310SGW1_9HYME|nr:hypothetical protein WN48_00593 [Eufriesea mexicana]